MSQRFPPIAIVGRACVLPGALSPEQLWEAVAGGRDLTASAPAGRWRVPVESVLCAPDLPHPDCSWNDRGGYVSGFESVWDPHGFAIEASALAGLDPLLHWVLHCAREALQQTRAVDLQHCGAIFGNLGFPSAGMAAFAQSVWSGQGEVDARNRFMSGGTAALLQRALGLGAGSYCLDAACASSLYAIKLACDALHDGRADLMLAGAVQGADDLFLHQGFSALSALSRSGQSRPFHRQADGLLPAEGAAFFALKRLADARRDGDHIHGVICGVGLSNDGRGKGLLVPDEFGQRRAIRNAFAQAGFGPERVSLLECHATGTPVGDATELRSSAAEYAGCADLPVGSLKSNLGHLITTAGAAGLIKVLEAMRAQQRPPSLHNESPTDALQDTPFRLLGALEAWPSDGPRTAAVSAFGFGGNNAHLLVTEFVDDCAGNESSYGVVAGPATADIALVALACQIATGSSRDDFSQSLFNGLDALDAAGEGRASQVAVALDGLRVPPKDLAQALPQQLAVLQAARDALAECRVTPGGERCAVYVGMEPDAEVARYGLRWRLQECSDAAVTAQQRDAVVPALQAAAVLGCMPNIPANRLNSQFDLSGPGFTVQANEHSGLVALQLAMRALRCGEIDAAVVGAVDFSCEPVHRAAAARLGDDSVAGDAALVCVLKRRADAEADGERIYALLDDGSLGLPTSPLPTYPTLPEQLRSRFGRAYAAEGMCQFAAQALSLHHRRHIDGQPWLSAESRATSAGSSGSHRVALHEARGHYPPLPGSSRLYAYAAADRAGLIAALREGRQGLVGESRIVLVAEPQALPVLQQRALAQLQDGVPAGPGVYYRERALGGGLAFCFAGAGAAYHGMGRELLQQWPLLLDRLAERSRLLAMGLDWAYADRSIAATAMQQLQGASALSQVHADLSQNLLGLRAEAWLGYSSGETNALFAAGVWNDADDLMRDMQLSGLMDRELGGRFEAISRVWGRPANWANWSLLASPEDVGAALAGISDVHLAIIHSDQECMIAGDADGCETVVERIGRARCLRMDYSLAVHVPELGSLESEWLQLHRRDTQAARSGQVYSSALGCSYSVSRESCAQAILQQAQQCLDLRPAILQAWNDGIRIFIEHGPGSSYSRAIRAALGDREALVLSLDRKGQGIDGVLHSAAALIAAGVEVDLSALHDPGLPVKQASSERVLRVDAHAAAVRLSVATATSPSAAATLAHAAASQHMLPAPRLPSRLMDRIDGEHVPAAAMAVAAKQPEPMTLTAQRFAPAELAVSRPEAISLRVHLAQLAQLQQQFLLRQSAAHQQFLGLRQTATQALLRAAAGHPLAAAASQPTAYPAAPLHAVLPARAPAEHAPAISRPAPVRLDSQPGPRLVTTATPTNKASPATPAQPVPSPSVPGATSTRRTPSGPRFDREALKVHAGGTISQLFGPQFTHQDQHARQVRMPMPPLLLADRVVGLDAQADSMGRGTVWTETDVGAEPWYLHHGRMPAGVMIEAGQADLLLISYLGVDRLNRGQRVYRLLGCELTYHGDLPSAGDTLSFEISLDGHAAQGDVRLMFFHYDCHNGERLQLSVRKGQAGFFTDQELADSAGCLWRPEDQRIVDSPRLDPPAVQCSRTSFDRDALQAFADGDAHRCFGAGFEFARTHTRSPGIHGGRMLLQDRVTEFNADGGPWQRGYLRAELDIRADLWFFDGHFKNDPCMPGTLMFEGCLQMLAFYLAACGHSLHRDGWRFQPVPELPYQLQCRGQVLPGSRLLVTEVFVEEIVAGPIPTVYADLLCTVDGLKAFHARRVALQLVPDWPLLAMPADIGEDRSGRAVAVVDGFRFDQRSLLACALGRPSDAFGPMYRRFDGPSRVARLPSPPYHFISRIAEVVGAIGVLQAGARVVAEYDLPADVWYLDHNGCRRMPFAVLLEAALQPCGWLSSYVGSALSVDAEVGFRNLDGSGTVLAELAGGAGTLRTEVELLAVSATAGMIIETFRVHCSLDGRPVYRLDTVFGFFPPEALAAQAGLPTTSVHRELLQREPNHSLDLATLAEHKGPAGRPRLAADMLRMIDELQGYWPDAGAAGLGQLRALKRVDPGEWFFRAHFFQDPVQPGSLGLEAMLQLLQVYLLLSGMDAGIASPRFECIAVDQEHSWKYRGQVLPHHRQVHTTLEITSRGHDDRGAYAIGTASLWADGQRIYEAIGLGVRIVSAPSD